MEGRQGMRKLMLFSGDAARSILSIYEIACRPLPLALCGLLKKKPVR